MVLASRPRRSTRGSPTGFSLIEVLITLAIVALAILIGGYQANKAMKRARLDAAARDVQAICQRAANEMKMRGHSTFVRLEPNLVSGARANWRVTLWADVDPAGATPPPATADNNALDDPGDTLVTTYDAPSDIAFSTADAAVITTTNWSVNTATADSRYLICDFLSRTRIPSAQVAQINGLATLDITHRDMVPAATNPRLTPAVRYQLHLPAMWSPTVSRGVYDPIKTKWSDAP